MEKQLQYSVMRPPQISLSNGRESRCGCKTGCKDGRCSCYRRSLPCSIRYTCMGYVNPRSDGGSNCRNVVSPTTTGDTATGGEGTSTVLPPEEDMDIELQDEEAAEDCEKKE